MLAAVNNLFRAGQALLSRANPARLDPEQSFEQMTFPIERCLHVMKGIPDLPQMELKLAPVPVNIPDLSGSRSEWESLAMRWPR